MTSVPHKSADTARLPQSSRRRRVRAAHPHTAAGLPTTLGMPGGASETFSYDPGSNRMTQWLSSSSSSGKSQTGALTWNANGTLRQLQITDTYNSANTQTCTYNYDDLGRVGTNNWSVDNGVTCKDNSQNTTLHQKIEYDGYHNLYLKSGTVSFTPTYDYTNRNNHILSVGGQTITYDGMGNMTLDSFANTFSYDAEGRPVSINQGGSLNQIAYDALGRAAYWTANATTTQIIYDASGNKFAFMNGQSLINYFVPLTAGLQAVYDSTAQLKYYRHADWLGSSRLQLNTDGTLHGDREFAPYGETYWETTTADRSFTGQTQDTVNVTTPGDPGGLYDFLFRQYSPIQGRWLVPDPAGLAAVDLSNPQTWNRYAYVGNNPLSNVDPLGLCEDGVAICVTTTIEVTATLPDYSYLNSLGGGSGNGNPNRLEMIGDDKGGSGFIGNVSKFQLKQASGSTIRPIIPGSGVCKGLGRGLTGNPDTVGKQGGIPGVKVQLGAAAVIPQQFGFPSGAALAPYAPYIHGTIGNVSFSGVTDVIGGRSPFPPIPVRTALQLVFPGRLVLEIPGASDQGVNAPTTVYVPEGMGCPTATNAGGGD